MSQKITTFLWFDGQAEEAMNFYVSLFKDSKVLAVQRLGPGPDAKAFSCSFQLAGQQFHALNGGPQYQFTPAISLFVDCETQQEIDGLWSKLTEGGRESRCGWLVDRFGLSWQLVPSGLGALLGDPDPAKARRAMQAMMGMKKFDLAALRRAHAGE